MARQQNYRSDKGCAMTPEPHRRRGEDGTILSAQKTNTRGGRHPLRIAWMRCLTGSGGNGFAEVLEVY